MSRRPLRVTAALLAAAVPLLAAAGQASAAADGDATARGFGALMGGAGTVASAQANAGGPRLREAQANGIGGPGVVAGHVDVRVGAGRRGAAGALAEGTATARDVVLLDGRVVVSSLRVSVRAEAAPGSDDAGVADTGVDGLMVDGQAVSAAPGDAIPVSGVGTLTLFEQSSDGPGSVSANGLRLEVTDAGSGLAPGTEIVIGHVEVRAEAGEAAATTAAAPPPTPAPAPAPVTTTPAPAPVTTTPAPSDPPSSPDPTLPSTRTTRTVPPAVTTTTPSTPVTPSYTEPRPLPPATGTSPGVVDPPSIGLPRQTPPADLTAPTVSGDGYVFPVLGESGFSDDWGAPRADTGSHEGNDIFAAMGTPVVAVADGSLERVGVNRLGGNRLWLHDARGNAFYYAHLSAYAPGIQDGVQVRAGQVIAFVGNTGDAITTPPHLHFEVHPGDGDAVDPYPYLLAWERRTDVARAFTAATEARGQVPAAGAMLVGAEAERDTPPAGDDGLAEAVR